MQATPEVRSGTSPIVVGAAVVVVPGPGPGVVAGPLAVALLAGVEGAIAGTALGGLAGAPIGWGVFGERDPAYQTHIQRARPSSSSAASRRPALRARRLLSDHLHDDMEVYEPAPS